MPDGDHLKAALLGAAGAVATILGLARVKHIQLAPLFGGKRRPSALTWVEQPNPGWRPGQAQPHPFPGDEMHELDPQKEGSAVMYPFIISAVVPRPIAFICSVSKTGIVNLAPYSYFGVMSHDPPVVCIGTCAGKVDDKRKEPVKDSQRNILDTKEWTLNMMSEWFIEAANHTCGPFDPEIDELSLAGLTAVPSQRVKAPRIKESVVQLECKLRDTHEVKNSAGKVTSTIIIGEVVLVHVNKHVCTTTKNGHLIVDLAKYAPASRCGGLTYARVSEAYDLPRPGREAQWQNGG